MFKITNNVVLVVFTINFVQINLPISGQCSISTPPDPWKPLVFWRFEEIQKWNIGLEMS